MVIGICIPILKIWGKRAFNYWQYVRLLFSEKPDEEMINLANVCHRKQQRGVILVGLLQMKDLASQVAGVGRMLSAEPSPSHTGHQVGLWHINS